MRHEIMIYGMVERINQLRPDHLPNEMEIEGFSDHVALGKRNSFKIYDGDGEPLELSAKVRRMTDTRIHLSDIRYNR
jgi:hypothetical protein